MNPLPPQRSTRHQAARFAVLSAFSFVSYFGISALLHEWLGVAVYLAVLIALGCVTAMNFCVLRLFVFEQTGQSWRKQLAGYLASIAGFRAAEYLAFLLLCGVFALPYLPVFPLVLVISLVGKFVFLRGMVFSGPSAAHASAEVAA